MRVAAVDIGSNSVRFLLADVSGGIVRPLQTGLVTTRLGQGIKEKSLFPQAMERTQTALEGFFRQLNSYNPDVTVMAATSAVRDAKNSDLFLRLVKNRFGIEVKILSGKEEAYLTYIGVMAGLIHKPDKMVTLDIGGGSTELVWLANGVMSWKSIDVGAVRMAEGKQNDSEILNIIKPALDELAVNQIKNIVGVGGTITNLAAISLGLKVYNPSYVHGYVVTIKEVRRILKMLLSLSIEERKTIPGLHPDRADIIDVGVRILSIIMCYLNISEIIVSEADILYGLAIEVAKK